MENVQENNAQDIQNECLEELKTELSMYFYCQENMDEIRDLFWWILYFALSNRENQDDRDQTGNQMTFYYMTLKLLAALEKYNQSLMLTKE